MSIRTTLRHGVATLAALLLSGAAMTVLSSPATALPPGGASPDTAGTSGTVTPRQLAPGATISFSISGFPAGEVVSVKIDDGEFCSAKGVHGACVVHQQKSSKDGTVRGSFALPGDIGAGPHWLRFLASEEMTDDAGNYLGVKPYSLKGDTDFTVVLPGSSSGATSGKSAGSTTGERKQGDAVEQESPSGTGASGTGSAGGAGAAQTGSSDASDATAGTTAASASEEVVPGALRVPAPSAVSVPTATEGPGSTSVDEGAATSAAAEPVDEGTPWIGLTVLMLCAGAVAGAVLASRSGRRA